MNFDEFLRDWDDDYKWYKDQGRLIFPPDPVYLQQTLEDAMLSPETITSMRNTFMEYADESGFMSMESLDQFLREEIMSFYETPSELQRAYTRLAHKSPARGLVFSEILPWWYSLVKGETR